MEEGQKYAIRKRAHRNDEYEFILYLDNQLMEFGSEFGGRTHTKQSTIMTTRKMIADQYPSIKVTMVKVISDGIVVAAMPITPETPATTSKEPLVMANRPSS